MFSELLRGDLPVAGLCEGKLFSGSRSPVAVSGLALSLSTTGPPLHHSQHRDFISGGDLALDLPGRTVSRQGVRERFILFGKSAD